jgi:hypothetical protein
LSGSGEEAIVSSREQSNTNFRSIKIKEFFSCEMYNMGTYVINARFSTGKIFIVFVTVTSLFMRIIFPSFVTASLSSSSSTTATTTQ